MSEAVPYADILILALIAGFILLRLRSVLGQNQGGDDFFRRTPPPQESQAAPSEPVVQLEAKARPRAKDAKEESDPYLSKVTDPAVSEALGAIKARDPLFSATEFLQGARMAFEMVHDAFAKGDKETLAMLLSDAIYKEFSSEIEQRAQTESKTDITLVSVIPDAVTEASLSGSIARLRVRFLSQQIQLVRNAKGDIIEGDVSQQNEVEDEWLFERDVTSKNPNWKIIET